MLNLFSDYSWSFIKPDRGKMFRHFDRFQSFWHFGLGTELFLDIIEHHYTSEEKIPR